ncbi:MAG: hypothetical protein EOP06_14505 [Proteobacteria bacterium]|nr:MAG: hypothetical protein EOP06_14505 [Pseudomonadota bacterium]
MIRYPWNDEAVEQAISLIDQNWLGKAAERTDALIRLGRYEEKSSIWSKVKPVYMKLQQNKCIYCEQQMEGGTYGPIEWDLEHFRPKSNVEPWPNTTRHPEVTYDIPLGDASLAGYYWLAYDLHNYAASCKVCNTIFKLNFFPTLNERAQVQRTDENLRGEGSLLCYPLGERDEDPENLITYTLTMAIPKYQNGPENLRARVIIDFFGLNRRDYLHKQRAQMIGAVGTLLAERDRGEMSEVIMAELACMERSHIPHAACVRAFIRLWQTDKDIARLGYVQCRRYGFDPELAPPTL